MGVMQGASKVHTTVIRGLFLCIDPATGKENKQLALLQKEARKPTNQYFSLYIRSSYFYIIQWKNDWNFTITPWRS